MKRFFLLVQIWIWFSFRHLRRHPWRTMAVLIGIGLGAAVFSSVRLATDASLDSFSRSMDHITGKADLTVICPGGRVPEELVAKLISHRAVRSASPLMTTYVWIPGERPIPFLLVGIDPLLDRPFRERPLAESDAGTAWLDIMAKPFSLVLSQKLSERFGVQRGGRLDLQSARQSAAFTVSGLLSPRGIALVEGGEVAVTDISTMQEFTGIFGRVDRIDLRIDPLSSPQEIESLRSILPAGIIIEDPGEARDSGMLMIRSYQLNLSVLSFVSLFVGMFLVYSLISLHATSRRHELAVMRSIGASPGIVFFLFITEGSFFGLAGWIAGVPFGSFLVNRMLATVSSTISHLFVRVQVDQLSLSAWEIGLSLVLTLSVSLIAALQPAIQATRVPPREALHMQELYLSQRDSTSWLAILSLLLIAAVHPLSRIPGPMGVPIPGYAATFLLFAGFSLLAPWCLRRTGTILPPFLRRIGGVPAYLGGRYVRDSGTRSAVSVGALITAVALFVSLVIMIHSFRSTVETWVNQSIRGDLFLRPKMAEINRYRDPLPPEIVVELEKLGSSIDILAYRRISLRYGRIPYQFEPIDFEIYTRHSRFLMIEGDIRDLLPRLSAGKGVIVSEVFSNKTSLKVGDRFSAHVEGSDFDAPILGIFRDYRTRGGVVHYSLRHFQEATGDRSWSGVNVFFRSEAPDHTADAWELRNHLLVHASQVHRTLDITLGEDLRQAILRIFDETFAVTTVLLLIALLVASLGITTTLTVLVLERARQIHTLIAVGAGRTQVRAMIFWEAVLMIFVGECIGSVCGFLLSYILIFVINLQSFGWTFIYGVDWKGLFLSLPLIPTTALLAALPAGRLVFRQSSAAVLRQS
jgi:putative ABC transport system permease protein